jgi:hypothetical protein
VRDHDFAEMAAALERAVGCFGVGKGECPVDHGAQTMECDGSVHRLKIGSAADADRAETHAAAAEQERVEHHAGSRQARSDQADVSADGEGFNGIRQRARSADLDDAVGPSAAGKFDNFLVPVRRLDIIDHGRRPERLEPFGLLRRRGGRDHLRAQ